MAAGLIGNVSRREREQRIPRCDESRRSGSSKARRTVLPLLGEREQRIPRCYESRRSGWSKARRTVLPLLGERAGVRGKKRSANQRAGELPMELTILSQGKQSSTPGEAPSR